MVVEAYCRAGSEGSEQSAYTYPENVSSWGSSVPSGDCIPFGDVTPGGGALTSAIPGSVLSEFSGEASCHRRELRSPTETLLPQSGYAGSARVKND